MTDGAAGDDLVHAEVRERRVAASRDDLLQPLAGAGRALRGRYPVDGAIVLDAENQVPAPARVREGGEGFAELAVELLEHDVALALEAVIFPEGERQHVRLGPLRPLPVHHDHRTHRRPRRTKSGPRGDQRGDHGDNRGD